MATKRDQAMDPGLQQIDDLERDIIEAREQTWRHNQVSEEEIERYRPSLQQLAKAVTDRMRDEYRARRGRS